MQSPLARAFCSWDNTEGTSYKLAPAWGETISNAGFNQKSNGKPTQYWKLYQDKISPSKVLFRASSADNFKAGGVGDTFIKGK